jgi:predicted nucleic acid-binding protein
VIVVTDTSVILNLCAIGQQHLLRDLYHQVLAPSTVIAEFRRLASADNRFLGLEFPSWIEEAAPKSLHPSLSDSQRLHEGEVAALSLALEVSVDIVLIDDQAARTAALRLGLSVVGLLGILVEARDKDLIPALAPIVDRLQEEAGFWISPALRLTVLRAVGEAP